MFDFDELVKKFEESGFEVKCFSENNTRSATVKGLGIFGGFGEKGQWYKYLDERFAADNFGCFDKWSKCPLVIKLPCNFDELMVHIFYLGSEQGYKLSNSYDYLDNNPFPYEVENA